MGKIVLLLPIKSCSTVSCRFAQAGNCESSFDINSMFVNNCLLVTYAPRRFQSYSIPNSFFTVFR